MQVLTRNVKLKFECVEVECGNVIEVDPYELQRSGSPICPDCQKEMAIDDTCLITN